MTDRPTRPRVLVLLATYQGAPWIEEQVATLLAQEDVDLGILASDDGSSDDTRALLAAMAVRDPRLALLDDARRAGSAAANFRKLLVVADATGYTHIALSDQDDLWQPAKLANACRSLAEQEAALYSSAVWACWPDRPMTVLTQSPAIRYADFLFEGAGQGCTFVLTKGLFDEVRSFLVAHPVQCAPLHYHDWLIYALARSKDRRWIHDPVPSMRYRQHAGNDTGAQSSAGGIARRLHLIRSGWYRGQILAVVALCRIANPNGQAATDVERLMLASQGSWRQRFRWSWFTLTQGRRRLRDRLIVFVFALLGRV